MKINDDHMYHGAALTQIAEHPQFTAINAFKSGSGISRSAFLINDDTGVYLKYASKPTKPFREYAFTFTADHLTELTKIAAKVQNVYLALVCVKGLNICCVSYTDFLAMVAKRRKHKGADEDQYVLLATMPAGKSFRVYMNEPGVKRTMLGKAKVISRNNFPGCLFT